MKMCANWLYVYGVRCGYEICTMCKIWLYSVGPQGRLGGEHYSHRGQVLCATFGTLSDEVAENCIYHGGSAVMSFNFSTVAYI